MEGGDFGGRKEMDGKVEVANEVPMAEFENIGDNQHKEEMLMLSTKEINSSLSAEIIEGKSVDNSSDETLSQSDLSNCTAATKRVSKRKRNRHCKRKWLISPTMNGNERQPVVAKRKLAKVNECLIEKTEKCEKLEPGHEKSDTMANPVLENGICRDENAEKNFWQKGVIYRAIASKKKDNFSIRIPGTSPQSKPLVHNSGIIRMKLERLSQLRIFGKKKKEKLLMTETAEKMTSPNSDVTTAPEFGDTKIKDLKHDVPILLGKDKVDAQPDSTDTSHSSPEVKPKSKASFDLLRSYLSGYIRKISVDPTDIDGGHVKIKNKEIDQLLSISPQRISSGRTDPPNLVPYMPHYPSWVSLETEEEFLRKLVQKPPNIRNCLPGSNYSPVSMPSDSLSSKGKTVNDPGPSISSTPTGLNSKISDVGPLNLNNSGNSDSITKSGFSCLDSDFGDEKTSKGVGTRISSISKSFRRWGREMCGRFAGRDPKEKSTINGNPESGQREEPTTPSTETPKKTKKKFFGKNKSFRQVFPLTDREEFIEERAQAFQGDDNNVKDKNSNY